MADAPVPLAFNGFLAGPDAFDDTGVGAWPACGNETLPYLIDRLNQRLIQAERGKNPPHW
jgi:hypothetical protein